jgi:NADH-quinone oxidoreductase subunit E
MVMIFRDTYEDLTAERLGEIIDAFDAGKGASVPVGPQVRRTLSGPQSGLTSLRDEKAVLKSTRDEEDRIAAQKAAADEADAETQAAAAEAPPSNAAKPKTDAVETSAAVQSPSPAKVSAPAEQATSAAPPKLDAANANKTSEEVEKTTKQRSGPRPKVEPAIAAEPSTAGAGSKTSAKAAPKPSLDDPNRPAAVKRPEKPDDLKLISGIGPKIEGILHSLGIYTFAQVAAWRQEERSWVDSYLNFKGRIDRDDWVKQADALARGGVEEYVRVFGKDPR